jgi:hypothetical protein
VDFEICLLIAVVCLHSVLGLIKFDGACTFEGGLGALPAALLKRLKTLSVVDVRLNTHVSDLNMTSQGGQVKLNGSDSVVLSPRSSEGLIPCGACLRAYFPRHVSSAGVQESFDHVFWTSNVEGLKTALVPASTDTANSGSTKERFAELMRILGEFESASVIRTSADS